MTRPSDPGERPSAARIRLSRRGLLAGVGGVVGAVAGCSGPQVEVGPSRATTAGPPGFPGHPEEVTYPHVRSDGNRVLDGRTAIPRVDPIDISLDGVDTPAWVVGVPASTGSYWVAVDESGRVAAVRLTRGTTVERPVTPTRLPAGTPPVLGLINDRLHLWSPPEDAALHAVPAVFESGGYAYVDTAGRLAVRSAGGRTTKAAVEALPDARVLSADDDRVALLAGPTDRYGHGVLGDATEAGRVTTATVAEGAVAVDHTVSITPPAVIEGIAPIWADLTGSGRRDLIVTVSDSQGGARLVAFLDGTETAIRGPPVGTGNRWRHQLAVAPFAADGIPELAVVRTPHIGGRVEFYRATGQGLDIQTSLDGFSTHVIGSRNLDGALAVDADGDGRPELVVPNQQRRRLAGIRRTGDGARTAWEVPIDGTLASNLAAVTTTDGTVDVAVGRRDGTLRVWPGRPG